MSRISTSKSAIEQAQLELLDAIDALYAAANELSIVRPSDPIVPQLGSLAQQAEQIHVVLKKRLGG